MDIDSPASPSHLNSNNNTHLHRPHFLHFSQQQLKHLSNSNSLPQHVLHDLDENVHIIESPSFLPKGTFKTKGKSRPDLLHFKSSSFKRPLSPSLSIDSPTTSLAADLSQNFHIEQNNQNRVPTPKRSLFPNSMKFASSLFDDEYTENAMDISPLITKEKPFNITSSDAPKAPFRKPFTTITNSRGSSTSSLATTSSIGTSSSTLSSSSSSLSNTNSITSIAPPSFPIFNDCNNPLPRRAIRRAYSSITNNNRNTSMINGSLVRPSMGKFIDERNTDLDSFCVPSPILEKLTDGLLINLSSDHETDSENDDSPSLKREVGSPIQQRVSSKIQTCKTTRAKVRRTHSMFQNSQDYITHDKMATSLINKISTNMTLLSFENEPMPAGNATLPKTNIKTLSDSKNLNLIPRIDVEEFVNILDGKYSEFFDNIIVVDCRFEYEFNGGHIDGAINISSQSDLELEFLSGDKLSKMQHPQGNKTLLIFHCEFSSYRGPLMANHLRKTDRVMNSDQYPNLHYPDILILEGGYKNFFELQSHRCLPKCYVLMNDSKHQESCEIQMHRVRRDSKLQNSRSLKKAKSFHMIIPNSHSLHLRSRSQTTFRMESSISTSNIPLTTPSTTSLSASSSSSSTTTTDSSIFSTIPNTTLQPSSLHRARHSGSLLNLSRNHSLKSNNLRNSINSFSSLNSKSTTESEEDAESDEMNSYLSNRDGDGISSYFDSHGSTNTLSSLLEDSQLDFKFPVKMKSNNNTHSQSTNEIGTSSFKLSDALREHHQDTPITSHKKQKSSGHLYRAMTQPNLKF